ncbi:hypothetical protein GCM10009759_67260 [Kitasatospora saccharophila]|uniref:4Fe-4S Wbl-type domain-containing protein n=1 Tax=Kitasatospora saccharophila TaxID=407973 RepID=A0ABN2Y200_9ACTN
MTATIHVLKPATLHEPELDILDEPESDTLDEPESDVVRQLEAMFVSGLARGSQYWRLKALCARDSQPDDWFAPPRVAGHHRALAVCGSCPVRSECQDDAIACRTTEGIRGGLTGEEIALLLTHRKDDRRFDQIKAVLQGELVPLTSPEKRAAVRIAQLVGIGWEVWAPAMGIGYKAAAKRRREADKQLTTIPKRDLVEEIALADELRAELHQEFASVALAAAA